jgi:hypothetical protein
MPQYKLYAVGTTYPNPSDWSGWDEIAIVIADSPQQAMELGGDSLCIEIPLDHPVVLMKEHEPTGWGRDL